VSHGRRATRRRGRGRWTEWPTSTTPNTYPSTFKISPPTTGPSGRRYAKYQFQTDIAFSEPTTCTPTTLQGCTAPPPNAPGHFYPYWTLAGTSSNCTWEFGNMRNGNTFGGDAQYGKLNPNLLPDLSSPFVRNRCR